VSDFPAGSDWHPVERARARQTLEDASLVLTAIDIDHRIEFDGHEWCLLVPRHRTPDARRELDAWQVENLRLPAPAPVALPIDTGWAGVLGYLLVIWALPWLEASVALGWSWREIGWMDAALVRDGAWWRTVTALTLHGDLAHLAGNSLFGVLFGLLAGRLLGSGAAWLLILAGGALGNVLNAWLQADEFRSLGASTATFAALSLVGAVSWRRGYFRGRGWRRSLAPVFGGIALLVYTGLGGGGEDDNTDVVAHLTGFAAGFALGWAASFLNPARLRGGVQWVAGAIALGIVVAAWYSAGTV
jgi:rhomboid protease GluP